MGATVGADLVILLSDIDALYDADPRTAANAQPILEVQVINDTIRAMAGAANTWPPASFGAWKGSLFL